jgi:hypothetical protein
MNQGNLVALCIRNGLDFGMRATAILGLTFLLIGGCSRKCESDYEIIREDSVRWFGTNNYDDKIISTTQFLEHFRDSYHNTIAKSVHPDFREQFSLWNTNLEADVIFSTSMECVLHFKPSRTNSLRVQCTPYPVQVSLFGGMGTSDSDFTMAPPDHDLLFRYTNGRQGMFILNGTPLLLQDLYLAASHPKLFEMHEYDIVMTHEVRVILTSLVVSNPISRTMDLRGYTFFTGAKDFGSAIPAKAELLGEEVAQGQIQALFIASEFFRGSLVESRLKAISERILERRERQKSGKEAYSYWEFLRDKDELINHAKRFGLADSYAENFFQDYETHENRNVVFWRFRSHLGFMWQWACAGLVCLISTHLAIRLKSGMLRNWGMGVCLAAVLCVNGFVFDKRPELLTIGYWVLLGALFLLSVIPLSRKLFEEAAKKSNASR